MVSQSGAVIGQSAEILLVDDDPMALLICEQYIRRSGIVVPIRTFAHGQVAYEYLSHTKVPSRYLMLLDINMPVMNGWEFLDAMAENDHSHSVDVVIVSSSTDDADKQRAAAYQHVRHYVEKPINAETIEHLRQYLT